MSQLCVGMIWAARDGKEALDYDGKEDENATILPPRRPKTKILVDGGDLQETLQVKTLVGLVEG
jgi:hypothetical protein